MSTHQISLVCQEAPAVGEPGWRRTAPDTHSHSYSLSAPHRWRHSCRRRLTPLVATSKFGGRSDSTWHADGVSCWASLRGFRWCCLYSCDVERCTQRWRRWRPAEWKRPDCPQQSRSAGPVEPLLQSLSWPLSRPMGSNLYNEVGASYIHQYLPICTSASRKLWISKVLQYITAPCRDEEYTI